MVVDEDGNEGVGDENNFDYSWDQGLRGERHDIHRGQRHEAMVVRVNGRSWVAGGIDMGTMRARLRSHSDACAAGAEDSTKVPDVGRATVGRGACCYELVVVVAQSKRAASTAYTREKEGSAETKKDGRGTGDSCIQA
jgi:hypothetical protein